jgi:uncharacterized protein YjbJ (UPF0337 family)
MAKEPVKCAVEKIEGNVEEVAIHSAGNKLKNEDNVNQVKGPPHNATDDAKDVGREAIESVRNAPSRQ